MATNPNENTNKKVSEESKTSDKNEKKRKLIKYTSGIALSIATVLVSIFACGVPLLIGIALAVTAYFAGSFLGGKAGNQFFPLEKAEEKAEEKVEQPTKSTGMQKTPNNPSIAASKAATQINNKTPFNITPKRNQSSTNTLE